MKPKGIKKLGIIGSSLLLCLGMNSTTATEIDLGLEGNLGFSCNFGDANEDCVNAQSRTTRVNVGAEVANGIRLDVAADLAKAFGQEFIRDGDDVHSDFSDDALLDNATITFDFNKISGKPFVVIAGEMSEIPLEEYQNLPETLDPSYDLRALRQATGVRVIYTPSVEQIDHILNNVTAEVFVAEGSESFVDHDIEFGGDDITWGIRVTKDFLNGASVSGYYLQKKNSGMEDETQGGIMVAYRNGNKWDVYAGATFMDNNPNFPYSEWKAEGGLNYNLGFATALANVTYFDADRLVGTLGLQKELTEYLTATVAYQMTKYDEDTHGHDELGHTLGIDFSYDIGKTLQPLRDVKQARCERDSAAIAKKYAGDSAMIAHKISSLRSCQ